MHFIMSFELRLAWKGLTANETLVFSRFLFLGWLFVKFFEHGAHFLIIDFGKDA